MLLTFSKDRFKYSIRNGDKIHSIREDKGNRWKIGMLIHFWLGSPRNPRNNPHQFGIGRVSKIQQIKIQYVFNVPNVFVDGFRIKGKELEDLARNDGFDNSKGFFAWFNKDFIGKIIYWDHFTTNF